MWLWFALSAPLFFAITGFLDKYLLTKITHNASASALTVISGLAALPLAIMFGFFAWDDITRITLLQAAAAFASGSLIVWSYYYYYRSLEKADASLVYAVFELTIVVNYVFGRIFLGEHLSALQIVAATMIALGALALTLAHRRGEWRFRTTLLLLILAAVVLYSAAETLFKGAALETGFVATQFYNYAAYSLVSLLLLLHSGARAHFVQTIRTKGRQAWALALSNETIYLFGLLLANYALVLAPIAAVQAVISTEAVYMVILGALLTYFFPSIIKENVRRSYLIFKLSAIAVIIAGTILIGL